MQEITFELKGEQYTFAWSRKALAWLEDNGYKFIELSKNLENNPIKASDFIFRGALYTHQPRLASDYDWYSQFIVDLNNEYDMEDISSGLMDGLYDFLKTTLFASTQEKKKTLFNINVNKENLDLTKTATKKK